LLADDRIVKIEANSVVDDGAYVLFYRRRDAHESQKE